MTADSESLLPCPFCGGKAKHASGDDRSQNPLPFKFVKCGKCEAQGPVFSEWGLTAAQATEKAAAGWNSRCIMPEP